MTSQARDFDADLDFDRFGMTSFFEAGTLITAFTISSKFIGWREIGFDLSGGLRFFIIVVLPIEATDIRSYPLP